MKTLTILVILFLGIYCTPTSSGSKNMSGAAMLLIGSNLNRSSSASVSVPADTADTVTSAPSHTGSGFYDKTLAINGVRGGGSASGSTDVFSLNTTGTGASIVLEWSGKRVINGAGIDFIVFENPFQYNSNPSTVFMEPLFVEVSQDNVNYCGFSADYTNTPETTYSNNPANWLRFAGKSPVYYNVETNVLAGSDLYDVSKSGGDGFDLDNLSAANDFNIGCNTTLRDKIKTEGFIYLKLTAATSRTNPDTVAAFLQDSGAFGGPDIDGVLARYRSAR